MTSLNFCPHSFFSFLDNFSIVFVQVTQQVFVVKEWIHNARNEADTADLARAKVEKSLGTLK